MKELLKSLNQRPIAYYPIYRYATGSTVAGVLLSQIMYWFSKKDSFYKTDKEISEETKITIDEVKSAKNKIKKLGFIKVTRKGIPATTNYEIDWEAYSSILCELHKLDEIEKAKSEAKNTKTITKTTTKKEREENFYTQNKSAIDIYISDHIKKSTNIKNEDAYRAKLITKFTKEDHATLEVFKQWKDEYNLKNMKSYFIGKKFNNINKDDKKVFILHDIEKNNFNIILTFQDINKPIYKREIQNNFNEAVSFLMQRCIDDK